MRFKVTEKDFKNLKYNGSLFSVGVALLVTGLANVSEAQVYDVTQLNMTICQIMGLMEGSMGAFLTAVAGAGAIVASAFGAYRAGFSLIVVATSSFIIHSLVSLWFADYNCNAVASVSSAAPRVGSSSDDDATSEITPTGDPDPGEIGGAGSGGDATGDSGDGSGTDSSGSGDAADGDGGG